MDAVSYNGRTENDRDSKIIQVSLIPATDSVGGNNQLAQSRNFVQERQFNTNLEQSYKNAKSLDTTSNHSPNQQISDAIVYPDAFSKYPKDSYGNQVQPYSAINDDRDLTNTDIGFMTDVNKDTYKIVNKGVVDTNKQQQQPPSNSNLPFVVPSYASGIIGTVPTPNPSLLPPSGFQFPIKSSNTFETPAVTNVDPSIFSNVPTNPASNTFTSNVFNSQQDYQRPKPQQPTQDISPPPTAQSAYSGVNSYQATTTTVAPVKYTGGFGGAPGILGEQKNPGYAVKPQDAAVPSHVPTPSQPIQPPQGPSPQQGAQYPSFQQQPAQQTTPQSQSVFQNSFVPVPANGLVPPKLPGVIYDYSSLPGADSVTAINLGSPPSQQPTQSQSNNNINNNNNNFVKPTQQTQYQGGKPTLSSDLSPPIGSSINSQLSYTSSSNFPSNSNSNAQQAAGGNKYTGSFGGAPGVLGEQKYPGTAVTSGTSSISSAPSVQQPIISAPSSPTIVSTASNPTKYNGGFGGPPGILSPYDNVKTGYTKLNKLYFICVFNQFHTFRRKL